MNSQLLDHIRNLIQEHRIHTVRVTLTDNTNITRSRYVPAKAFLQALVDDGINYPSTLFSMDTSARLVAEAGDGYAGGYPSWLLKPDLNTFIVLPWVSGTARVIADVLQPNGEPVHVSPRQVLKNIIKQVNEAGFTVRGAFEFEFYVYKQNSGHLDPAWHGLNCFADVNQAQLEEIFTSIIQGLDGIGAGPEVANTEYGPGQFEITNSPFTGVEVADMAVYYRSAIKEILSQRGYTATFMGKPNGAASGSGGHFHFSMYNNKKQNVFFNPTSSDGLSDICRWAIGGQLYHARAICALVNSTINSYKRLLPYTFAPVNASWGHEHRCTMIRVPAARGYNTRLENRLPAADTNPYLASAAILAASLDGIKNKIEPPVSSDGLDPYAQENLTPLPSSLSEALEELQRDNVITSYMGKEFIKHYITLRKSEWQRYQTHVSDWEIKEYLDLF